MNWKSGVISVDTTQPHGSPRRTHAPACRRIGGSMRPQRRAYHPGFQVFCETCPGRRKPPSFYRLNVHLHVGPSVFLQIL